MMNDEYDDDDDIEDFYDDSPDEEDDYEDFLSAGWGTLGNNGEDD